MNFKHLFIATLCLCITLGCHSTVVNAKEHLKMINAKDRNCGMFGVSPCWKALMLNELYSECLERSEVAYCNSIRNSIYQSDLTEIKFATTPFNATEVSRMRKDFCLSPQSLILNCTLADNCFTREYESVFYKDKNNNNNTLSLAPTRQATIFAFFVCVTFLFLSFLAGVATRPMLPCCN